MTDNSSIKEDIRAIKKDLRLSMNGVVSTLQRNQGLNYKINFGVEIPRLKGIAARYLKNKELALALWEDNIRECKMLAIFLMPEEFYGDIAERWATEAPYTEIADHLAKEILCKIPNINETALRWLKKEEGLHCYCGYMTLTHLFRKGTTLPEEQEDIYIKNAGKHISEDVLSPVAKAAYNSLVTYADSNEEKAIKIEEMLDIFNPSKVY